MSEPAPDAAPPPTLSYATAREPAIDRWMRPIQRPCCAVLMISTGIASGSIQTTSCPHATYLQFLGLNIAITGHACRNPQDERIWWLRR